MKIEYLHNYKISIVVYHQKGRSYGEIYRLEWFDITFNVLSKWRWYFDYRHAMLKVQYPKNEVKTYISQIEPDKKTISHYLKDKIAGKKRVITKTSNELRLHKQWLLDNDIFGLSGDDGRIEKAEAKIKKNQNELEELENQLKNLLKTNDS